MEGDFNVILALKHLPGPCPALHMHHTGYPMILLQPLLLVLQWWMADHEKDWADDEIGAKSRLA